MFRNNQSLKWMVIVGFVVFVYGLLKLFWLRFEAGDIYPPYSSLRTDPLGTCAFYESLEALPEVAAERNYLPFDRLDLGPGTTHMIFGLSPYPMALHSKDWEHLIARLSEEGGRVVVSFRTTRHKPKTDDWDDEDEKDQDKDTFEREDEETTNVAEKETSSWLGLKSLGIGLNRVKEREQTTKATRDGSQPVLIPETIGWYTDLFFEIEDNDWKVLYTFQRQPVVITRTWGKGSLVFAADTYLFSNEALRGDRVSDLLTWFVAPAQKVMFDEYHLGLVKQPGIAGLVRQYRLQWVTASLVVLFLLFVWRQTVVFNPRPMEEEREREILPTIGGGTFEGLASLFRKHIKGKNLLRVCFDSWRSSTNVGSIPKEVIETIKRLVVSAEDAPFGVVKVYQQICKEIEKGKKL